MVSAAWQSASIPVASSLSSVVSATTSAAPGSAEFTFTASTRSTLGLAFGATSVGSGCHAVGALHVATGVRARPPLMFGVTASYMMKVPRSVAPLLAIEMRTAPPRATARVRAERKSIMMLPASL